MLRTDKLTHAVLITGLVLGIACMAPVFYNSALTSKLLFVVISAGLSGLAYAAALITKRKFEVVTSPLLSVYGLFALSVLASVFFTNQYPVQNLLGTGGFQLASALVVLFGVNLLAKEEASFGSRMRRSHQFIDGLLVAGAIVGLTSLLQLFGVGPAKLHNWLFGLNFPNTVLFNLTGSAFVAAQVGVVALVALIGRAIAQKQLKTLDLVALPFLLVAVALNVWAVMPGKPAAIVMPDFTASWSIAIETLRTPRSALIGFGTDAYSDVFTRFKPIWLNGREFWQVAFGAGANYPLTLIVTQGLFGLVTWVTLVIFSGKFWNQTKPENRPVAAVVLSIFLLQFFLPPNLVLLGIQAIALIYWIAAQPDFFSVIQLRTQAMRPELDQPNSSHRGWLLPTVAGWLIVAALLLPALSIGRAYAGFYRMYLSEKAALKNDAIGVYEQQRQAVIVMPYLDSIRRQYALTNLQIAIALSSNKNLTDADRTQITQLISQAIREAKAATIVDPNNTQNWVALAEIYRNISGVAKEADQWAVDSLVSAIGTDPTNPLLRIDLGQTFFQKGQYEDAARFYNQAIELKPDLAGGYFQLGRTLKELGQLDNAKVLLEKSRSLVTPESEEYQLISKGIVELEQAMAASGSGTKATTTPPKLNSSGLLETQPTATNSALLNLTKNGSTGLGSLTEQNTKQSEADIVNNTQSEPLKTPSVTPTP